MNYGPANDEEEKLTEMTKIAKGSSSSYRQDVFGSSKATPMGRRQLGSQASSEEQEIRAWISSVRFKRQAIGGLDEKDVWNKIGELDALYAKALAAEKLRCDALVAHWRKVAEGSQAQQPEMQARLSKPGGDKPRARHQGGGLNG